MISYVRWTILGRFINNMSNRKSGIVNMSKEQEILGVLLGTIYEKQASRHSDGERSVAEVLFEIGKALSISKKDILEYVQKKGFPTGFAFEKEAGADGLYCVRQQDGSYRLYSQERGCKYNEEIHSSYSEAVRSMVDRVADPYFNLQKTAR